MSCAFALRVDLEGAFLTLSGREGVRELWGTVSCAFALRVDLEGAFLTLSGGKGVREFVGHSELCVCS